MNIKSDLAILDVKAGRRALAKLVKDERDVVPVTIRGWITRAGNDDGVSTEFDVRVKSVTLAVTTP